MNRTLNILKCMLLMVVVSALIVPSATAMTVWYELDNAQAGELDTHYVDFQLSDRTLPSNGKIKVQLPDGFNVSEAILVLGSVWNSGGLDNGVYTLVRDVSTRTLILVRDGTGADYPVGTEVRFELDRIKNPNIGDKTIEVSTTTSGDNILDIGTDHVTINPGPATHLNFTTINSQVAGTAFPITVTARDQFENIDTAFSDPAATLSNSLGTITPDDIEINAGTGTESVTITKTGTGNITVTSGTITGASNQFTVTPAALTSFEIATIPNQFDELAFTVTAQAKDGFGNNKTNYNKVDTLSVNPGAPGTISIVSPSPATVQFINGVYSGQVRLNVVPDPTATTPHVGASLIITDGPVSGTSTLFNVVELPIDLVNSTVVAYPLIVPEDWNSASTITVTVKNSITQAIIPGVSVTLSSSRGSTDGISPSSNNTGSDGKAIFTVSSWTTGTANITATVKGTKVLDQKATVYFGYDNMLHLSKDWNLVSVPRQLNNSAISALGTTKVDRIYTYDAENKNWKYALYNKTSGTWNGTLTAIDDGKGYWMFASAVTDIPVVLKSIDPMQVPPTYPLKAGWNLIGYTSMQLKPNTDVFEYFYPDLFYQSDSPIWVSAYDWTGSGFDQASPWGDDFSIVITKGYWVYLKDNATLVP